MKAEGPQLEVLLHRLSECPEEFLQVAVMRGQVVNVVAIVCDHLRAVRPEPPPEAMPVQLARLAKLARRRAELVSVVCWLLHDPWFLAQPKLADAMWELLLSEELAKLSELVKPAQFVHDPDRREELVRVCLRALGLRPRGETEFQATDRLTTLDSAERQGVLRATAAAERRARQVREAMVEARAQESASRYGE